jgi:hypothetical protein
VDDVEPDDEDFVYKNLKCSSVFNNEIRGNRYNENYNYIAIKYKKCPEGQNSPSGEPCLGTNSAEYKSFMAERTNTEINVIFNDIYTEVNDPINTIKKYTNDRYFFSMTEGRTPMLDIFVQSGRFKDSFLTLFGRDEPIHRIGNIREHEVNMDQDDPLWFSAIVRMDNKEVTVVRTEYTYTNMFAEIGGL